MAGWAYAQSKRRWSGGAGALFTVGIHIGLGALLLATGVPQVTNPVPISVSVISDTPQRNQPLEPLVNKPRLDQPKLHIPQPDIVLADDEPAIAAPVAVTTAPARSTAEVAAAAPVSQPIFDADYLKNAGAVYPQASRRMREEGTVFVRVLVSAAGLPDQVELKRSSGSARLDEAALCAVRKWRFVPARRGAQAVAAWVVVPIAFSLAA